MCVIFYYFPDSQRSCHSCQIWNSKAYFPDFTVFSTTMNEVYKTNIDCFFIRRMVENYCPLGKIQPWLTILRASVNSRPRLNFTLGTTIFHHSPHGQSIFVSYHLSFMIHPLQRNPPNSAVHSYLTPLRVAALWISHWFLWTWICQ